MHTEEQTIDDLKGRVPDTSSSHKFTQNEVNLGHSGGTLNYASNTLLKNRITHPWEELNDL